MKVRFGGLILLLVPFIGWPAALGYRKALIARLREGVFPPLPDWRGNLTRHFLEGIKALAVIFGYYAPLYMVLWLTLVNRGLEISPHFAYAAIFFLVFPIFSPLAFPLAVLYFCFSELALLSGVEAALLLMGYTLSTFLIPAGFLQVSLSGRYRSAFALDRSLPWLQHNFRAYCRAWYLSMLMSLCGHFAVPFSPWGVIWCYLGIIFAFNRLIPPGSSDESWFSKLRGPMRIEVRGHIRSRLLLSAGAAPGSPKIEEAIALRLGPVALPLPRCITRALQ